MRLQQARALVGSSSATRMVHRRACFIAAVFLIMPLITVEVPRCLQRSQYIENISLEGQHQPSAWHLILMLDNHHWPKVIKGHFVAEVCKNCNKTHCTFNLTVLSINTCTGEKQLNGLVEAVPAAQV